ncbi:hypothetical protein DES53_10272 [Roseimicrobium gellanilyticum]|uniref:Uncharacterized protein n=1 Tax=Roseimicrobium gellanilyticum TaxID=748857 RepID=A0A366HPW9_9BACT|nr:hypothetical protein DES53_10272 [Roseimicrobium gellanilyticum]
MATLASKVTCPEKFGDFVAVECAAGCTSGKRQQAARSPRPSAQLPYLKLTLLSKGQFQPALHDAKRSIIRRYSSPGIIKRKCPPTGEVGGHDVSRYR